MLVSHPPPAEQQFLYSFSLVVSSSFLNRTLAPVKVHSCDALQCVYTRRRQPCQHIPKTSRTRIRYLKTASRKIITTSLYGRDSSVHMGEGMCLCATRRRSRLYLPPRRRPRTSASQSTQCCSIWLDSIVSQRAERHPHRTARRCAGRACA